MTRKFLLMLIDFVRDYPTRQLLHRPLHDMPAVKDTPFPLLKDYFEHLVEGYDDLDRIHKEGRDMDLRSVDTPAFYICGWYDSARNALIEHCRTQRDNGVDSRVLIAPWRIGESPARADSALETGENIVDVQREMVDWFDCWLKQMEKPAWKPYRYYDIVTQTAFEGDSWRDDSGVLREFFLQCDGRLTNTLPSEGAAGYVHDPKIPLPFVPYGPAGKLSATGPKSLRYISQPFESTLVISGLVRARMYLASDAKDTDVILRLCDIGPDDIKFVICDGAIRARYRNGWTSEPLESGKVYALDVMLGSTRYTLRSGHRLALEITGSAFPKYDVNYGTAERPAGDTGSVVSHNLIYSSIEYASRLQLPLEE